jgi:hypothetical protein
MKRWLRNWLMNDDSKSQLVMASVDRTGHEFEEDNTMRFTITPARGGIVVSVRQYDRKTDRTNYTNHVIHDDENVAESIGHVVSMELLRS